jgi:hypothetical protein
MDCEICNKSYKSASILRIHYTSAIHKSNLDAKRRLANPVQSISTSRQHINNQSAHQIPNNPMHSIPENIPTIDSIINNLHENTNTQITENISIKHRCPGCEKDYSQKPSLYRHQKKCSFYKEAYKLSSKTQIDVAIAARLIKQKHLSKNIPHLRLEEDISRLIPSGNITNNNTTNNNTTNNNTTNNNTTINNFNITVGSWETLNFIRPFLHENISHLYTHENRIKIIADGNNAVNTAINLLYKVPENKNIYRYNSRRNFVKTPNVNGDIVSYPANEAFSKLAVAILDITDDIMTNSEDILKEYPQYRRGVDVYADTNNWNGESGNDRYKEYEKTIELNIETSHKKSETNIIQFENAKQTILLNGGKLEFNNNILGTHRQRPESQIQKTITALQEKLHESIINEAT